MSRSAVDKYSQILAQDPSSTVFVELAKAFIDRGDHQRAIEVCQQGLAHHPKSVVGRVLWGKALINLGKASEAMNQFDLAANIDRDNAHAYNLIGEVLLRKGLYRSALPILRKAATLQPNDGRVKQWLEQTRAALAGGPAPMLGEETSITDGKPLAPEAPPPAENDPMATVVMGALTEDGAQIPTVVTRAYAPENPAATVNEDEGDEPLLPVVGGVEEPRTEAHDLGRNSQTQELPATNPLAKVTPAPEDSDPFAAVPRRAGEPEEDVVRGLTSTFDALAEGASADGFSTGGRPTSPGQLPVVTGLPINATEPKSEPTIIPSNDLLQGQEAKGGGLLEDVVSEQVEVPAAEQAPVRRGGAARGPPPVLQKVSSGGLLDEIPDMLESHSALESVPKVELNTQTTEAIAKEYERELREKLAKKTAQKTFLQRHGLKIAVLSVLLVAGLGGLGAFIQTRRANGGKDLNSTVTEARGFINADTRELYLSALKSLDAAARMDSSSPEVWALTAWSHAVLYADYTRSAADKAAATAALSHSGVRDAFPELALVIDWFLSDAAPTTKQQLLASQLAKSEVLCEQGRVLLADGKMDDAYKQLDASIKQSATNVRAMVALGDYYVAFEDYEGAVNILTGTAAQLSPSHPGRALALAQARLELGKNLAESLTDVTGLPPTEQLSPSLRAKRDLVQGRLLSANGKHEEALKLLNDGATTYKDKGYEFQMALGGAYRAAGQMEKAQKAYETAFKLNGKSEEAREGLGRVLLARSRERELLADKRLASGGGRKISLVRGIAYTRLGDWKNAKAELARTQVNGKFPSEAAVYLAVGDASEEGGEKAIAMLEKLAATTKKNKATVQVALARVYMQKSALDKAKAQLEEAAKDPADYEANATLGELLLNLGLPEVALEPLTKAVERNGSALPARRMLVRTLLVMGRATEALKSAEAGVADNPTADETQSDLATALYFNGKIAEADAASQKVKANDVETWRTRAKIQFALGDPRGAMKSLESANKLNPHDAETFCEIGAAFVRQGSLDTALAAYQAAAREDAKSVCAKIGPYHVRPYGGKPQVKELSDLAKSAPNSWDKALALSALARLHANAGSLKEAREAADDALGMMPSLAISHWAAGVVAQRQKDDKTAETELGRACQLDASLSPAVLAYADLLGRGEGDAVKRAVQWYEAFLNVSQSEADTARVRRGLPLLKKKLQ